MYVRLRRLGGFWSTLIGGSETVFKDTIPVAAAAATGGASAAVVAGGTEALSAARGKGKPGAAAASSSAPAASGNFLGRLSSGQVIAGGLALAALAVALGGRRR